MMSIAYAEFETTTQSEQFVPHVAKTQTALLHCLVLAKDAERREFLEVAAEAAGWQVTAFADANIASNAAHRFRHSLVIVDLEGTEPGNSSSLRALTEQLSADAQRLLIVCGTEGNPLEEIWARQLGVWLYLAGVDLSCDVESLCSEARQVADKLATPAKPQYARTA
jgi:DNA-binding NtrC family response regulator